MISPDLTQAGWELGSAAFGLLNVRAIRRSKSIAGIHWLPTAFFAAWGLYNLWFYAALHLPIAWWAGLAITAVNLVWLAHVGWYLLAKPAPCRGAA
jgi:hypothetical protein